MAASGPQVRGEARAAGAPALEIRVLGPIELALDGRVVELGGIKARALVARLLVDRNIVVSGEVLGDELWGEDAGRAGQVALRSTVSRLRKRIVAAGGPGDLIVTRVPGYMLASPADATDAHRFERLVAAGRQAVRERRYEDAVGLLEEAEATWCGPAYREVCDEPFARAEARRLDELRLSAIETRIDTELTLGRHGALAGQLESLTSAHPLRERLWSQRMLALYRAGRQAEAVRVFQELRGILVTELGIEPGHDVTWLDRAILAQDPALDFLPSPPSPRPLPGRSGSGTGARPAEAEGAGPPWGYRFWGSSARFDSAFVGREREVARLRAWWDAAATPDWRILLVEGDAGVGKTRLVAEMGRILEAEGAVVLWGRCDEDPAMPYQPIAEALGRYFDAQSADQISAMPAWQRDELSRLVPRLVDHAPPFDRGGEAERDRYRFFEAVLRTLQDLAAGHQILLVVDDVHRLDQPTVLLLRYVLRRAAGRGVGFVGTMVDTEVRSGDLVRSLLADGRVASRVETVRLGGLDPAAVELLVRATPSAPVALVPQLCERTDGNPLFLQELLRRVVEPGPMASDAGGTLLLPDLTPTEAIRELVARRVSGLPEDVVFLLQAASVAGRVFDAAVVAEAAELDGAQRFDAYDRAEESRLLRRVTGPGDRYAFTHALVREVIYDELLQGRRLRYHHKIARCTERIHGDHLDAVVGELALHFAEGAPLSDADKAVRYGLAAGQRAMRTLAFEEAVVHFARALEVLDRFGAPDVRTRGDLLLALAEAQNRAGERDRADERLEQAADQARRAGDVERLATVALRASPPDFFGRIQPDAKWAALLREALAALPEDDSPLRAMVLARLAQALTPEPGTSPRQSLDHARAISAEAVAVARRLGELGVLGFVLSARLQTLWGRAPARERLATSIELGELAEETLDDRLALQSTVWRVRELLAMGAAEALHEELAALQPGQAAPEDPLAASFRHSAVALRALLAGDLAAASRASRRFLEDVEDFGAYGVALYGSLMWWTWWQQGGLGESDGEFRSLLSRAYFDAASEPVCWAHVHAEAGETHQALDRLQALAEVGWPDSRADLTEGITLAVAAAACHVVGARAGQVAGAASGRTAGVVAELSERIYQALQPFAGTLVVVRGPVLACAGPADHYLGMMAEVRGELTLAEVHLEAALHLARRISAAPFVAAVEVDLARVLRRRRRDAAAERVAVLLRDAEESALHMGLRRLAALAAEPG